MKTKTGWLVVILITSLQLATLLFAVIVLFSWFVERTEETFVSQACQDNQVISDQLEAEITRLVDDQGVAAALTPEALRPVFFRVRMPNAGFVCLVDATEGEQLFRSPSTSGPRTTDLLQAPLEMPDGRRLSLWDAVTQSASPRQAEGRVQLKQNDQVIFARYLPAINAILITAQQQNRSMAGIIQTIHAVQRIAFGVSLLSGLVCMCLVVSILNRMTAKVDDQHQGLERQLTEREKQIVRTQSAVIFGLAKLAESRDNDTGEHLDRIRHYVLILSQDLRERFDEIDQEFVNTIELASSLHDVGKVGIPDAILLKPGRLTSEEREVMELHTLIGGECLEAIQTRLGKHSRFMQIAKEIAYHHHERWDGKGYPHGLRENEIPLVARIVAVADVYDALTSKRPYKKPMSHLESRAIILSGSGSQFDPEVVDAFLRHEDEFEAISRSQAELSDEAVTSNFQTLCSRAQQATPSSPG